MTYPKEKYIQETKSLTQASRMLDKPEEVSVCGHEISVFPQVFNPDIFFSSCWFADEVNKEVGKANAVSFCEVGSGTGIVSLIVAEKNPNVFVTACDINPNAVENTQENLERHGLAFRSNVLKSDVFSALGTTTFDVIFWALPFGYVEPETKIDMVDYQTFDPGYQSIEKFFKEAPNHLTQNGTLLFGFSPEIGDWDLIKSLAEKYRWQLTLTSEQQGMEKSEVGMQLYSCTPQ